MMMIIDDDDKYNDNDRNDQNLEMMMIYDNSRQVWTQVRHNYTFLRNIIITY